MLSGGAGVIDITKLLQFLTGAFELLYGSTNVQQTITTVSE
jgi:hypothetical protein